MLRKAVKKLRKHNERTQVCIHLDEQTQRNLRNLKADRKRLGLSRQELAERLGVKYSAVADYELGRNAPHLSRYLLLAEIFGWDIKDSANYKFAMTAEKYKLKKRKDSYGLNAREISRLSNFSESSIENALYMHRRSTINSFAAVVEVLDEEERRSKLVHELTRKSKS